MLQLISYNNNLEKELVKLYQEFYNKEVEKNPILIKF